LPFRDLGKHMIKALESSARSRRMAEIFFEPPHKQRAQWKAQQEQLFQKFKFVLRDVRRLLCRVY
jgi:hypothetical protein